MSWLFIYIDSYTSFFNRKNFSNLNTLPMSINPNTTGYNNNTINDNNNNNNTIGDNVPLKTSIAYVCNMDSNNTTGNNNTIGNNNTTGNNNTIGNNVPPRTAIAQSTLFCYGVAQPDNTLGNLTR